MARVLRFVFLVILLLSTAACSQTKQSEDWTVSSVFPIYETTAEGRQIEYPIRGHEGQFGFIDSPFVAGKSQKYMWFFWGDFSGFAGKFLRVTAVKKAVSL